MAWGLVIRETKSLWPVLWHCLTLLTWKCGEERKKRRKVKTCFWCLRSQPDVLSVSCVSLWAPGPGLQHCLLCCLFPLQHRLHRPCKSRPFAAVFTGDCYSLATEHLASALGSSNAGHLLCSVAWLDPGKPGEVCQPGHCLINFVFLDSLDLSVWKVKLGLREINGILLPSPGLKEDPWDTRGLEVWFYSNPCAKLMSHHLVCFLVRLLLICCLSVGTCLWLLQHHVLTLEANGRVNNKSLCAGWARVTEAVPWCAVFWGRHWTGWFEFSLTLVHPWRRTVDMLGATQLLS